MLSFVGALSLCALAGSRWLGRSFIIEKAKHKQYIKAVMMPSLFLGWVWFMRNNARHDARRFGFAR